MISIHAPLTGCDFDYTKIRFPWTISIHAPLTGCDAGIHTPIDTTPEFQSTHPSRGATKKTELKNVAGQISIHAPLTGCDNVSPSNSGPFPISIHAPLTGCDYVNFRNQAMPVISIHAPLTGCDLKPPG